MNRYQIKKKLAAMKSLLQNAAPLLLSLIENSEIIAYSRYNNCAHMDLKKFKYVTEQL